MPGPARVGSVERSETHHFSSGIGGFRLAQPTLQITTINDQFGTQTAALISPNSRAILRQEAPASSVTYTSPNRLNATMRSGSAGCVARPHTVAFGWVGSFNTSQVSPKFAVRSTSPVSPVVVSPQPANSTA